MSSLSGKKILLGISGGIAAYKTPLLVRELIKFGAEIRVLMTPFAKDFVTPLTLSALSKNPVLSSFTNNELDNPVWNNHVELGLWADLYIIAPATSNTLSSMAQGRCNNLLLATYLSAKCPVFIAPCDGFGYVCTSIKSEKHKSSSVIWKSNIACRRRKFSKWS